MRWGLYFLGLLLSAYFSFSLRGIRSAFKDAFAERLDLNRSWALTIGILWRELHKMEAGEIIHQQISPPY